MLKFFKRLDENIRKALIAQLRNREFSLYRVSMLHFKLLFEF